jgi:hypothetical protein
VEYAEIKNASNTAKQVHDFLTKRERNRRVLNLKLLAYNINVNGGQLVVSDYEAYFKGLEALGAGVASRDTQGVLRRFTFQKPMLQVIGAKQAQPVADNVVKMRKRREVAPKITPATSMKTVLLGLRSDVDIEFNVPYDLTTAEAERIFQLLKKAAS